MKEKLSRNRGLIDGILSVLLWTLAPTTRRILSESLSPYYSSAIVYLISGLYMYWKQKRDGGFYHIRRSNKRYWILCAVPYLIYSFCSFMASGLARTRDGAILANLFNSLWALGGLVFTVPILHQKVKKSFYVATALCIFGAAYATVSGASGHLLTTVSQNWAALLCGILVPITWGLYSDYYCIIVRESKADYLPLLILTESGIMFLIGLFSGARIVKFDLKVAAVLLLQVLLVDVGANLLWNNSMRDDSRMTVILFSNLSPVLTTFVSSLFLGVPLNAQVYVGAFVIVLSTLWAKASMITPEPDEPYDE